MISQKLLEILACPACKSDIKKVGEEIHCTSCLRIYPIRNDIPVMLVEESRLEATKNESKE